MLEERTTQQEKMPAPQEFAKLNLRTTNRREAAYLNHTVHRRSGLSKLGHHNVNRPIAVTVNVEPNRGELLLFRFLGNSTRVL